MFCTSWWFLTSHAISDVTHNTRVCTLHHAARETSCHSRYAGTRQCSTVQHARKIFSSVLIIAMAAKVLLCRLCWESSPDHKVTNIFTGKSLKKEWPCRISSLLDIPVDSSDQLPPHVCFKCLTRVVSLEKASANLTAFKSSARSVMEQALRPLKRTKETSGEVNVSPNTLRVRPQSKIPRSETPFYKYIKWYGKSYSIKVWACNVRCEEVPCLQAGTFSMSILYGMS